METKEITSARFGEIVLVMLQKASFPGEESESVTELKRIATQLKEGAMVFARPETTTAEGATPIIKK